VCSNGLTIGRKLLSKARRHVGNETLDKLIEFLGQAEETLTNEVVPKWRAWANIELTTERGVEIINALTLPECYKESAIKQWSMSHYKTVWELYNSLTYVLTHETRDISMERQRALEEVVADGFVDAVNIGVATV